MTARALPTAGSPRPASHPPSPGARSRRSDGSTRRTGLRRPCPPFTAERARDPCAANAETQRSSGLPPRPPPLPTRQALDQRIVRRGTAKEAAVDFGARAFAARPDPGKAAIGRHLAEAVRIARRAGCLPEQEKRRSEGRGVGKEGGRK